MKLKLKINYLYTILIIALVGIAAIPAYKYYETFHDYGLSPKNQDWANAGSFFGGIYSSIFSFASTIILSITLIITKKYNNQQLDLLLTSQKKADFCSLFDKLTIKMNSIDYFSMGFENENAYFERCENELFNDLLSITGKGKKIHVGNVFDLSTNLMTSDWHSNIKPYYDVILITAEILNMLDEAPEKIKDFYFAYMDSNSSTQRLYWLFCYMYSIDDKYKGILLKNPRALRIPKGYI